jgi:signal transduction histidine kinase
MLSLVYDLLDFSQIVAGKFRVNLDTFNFVEMLDNVENIIGCLASKKGLRTKVIFDSECVAIITSDEQRIMQVILNLMSNAIKFTTEGFISIMI